MGEEEAPKQPRTSWFDRLLDLGPKWLSAIAALIIALPTAAAFFAEKAAAPSSGSTVQPTQPVASSSISRPTYSSTSNATGTGYLADIRQTPPGGRPVSTATVNNRKYPGSFQLVIPSDSTRTFTYALDGKWSQIKLLMAIPDGDGGSIWIGVTISIDGQQLKSGSVVPRAPYTGQFSVSGVKNLTISFGSVPGYDGSSVVIAGDLSR
jgi:hypothetical protein